METPNTYRQALDWYASEQANPSQSWLDRCKLAARLSYKIPMSLSGSAFAAFEMLDDEDVILRGGDPTQAPAGALLFFKGSNPDGHVDIAALDEQMARSNDLRAPDGSGGPGQLSYVLRTAPLTQWGHRFLGAGLALDGYDLQLKQDKPAKPKQDKAYKRVQRAIDNLEASISTASKQHDDRDVKLLTREMNELKHLFTTLRHS